MSKTSFAFTLCAALLLVGCAETPELTEPGERGSVPVLAAGPPSATGGGHMAIGALDVEFAFSAVQLSSDGTGVGQLRFSVVLDNQPIEFHGRVTCVTFDAANARAWVGGVVTQNNSTHPAFTGEINQPGRDIWFRVVDYGEGAGQAQPDRATFVGFEGSADIITSAEYCAVQPWPEGDARTNPLTEGNINVKS